MEKSRILHLERANTLGNFLTKEDCETIVSLKVMGYIGQKDFQSPIPNACCPLNRKNGA